jgi:hypothetical protein
MGIIGEIVSDRSDPLAPSAAMSGNLKDGHMHLAWPRDATECRRWTRWHGTPNLGAGPAAFLLNGDERLPHRWNIHGRTRPFPRVPRTLLIRAQRRSGEALRRCQCRYQCQYCTVLRAEARFTGARLLLQRGEDDELGRGRCGTG